MVAQVLTSHGHLRRVLTCARRLVLGSGLRLGSVRQEHMAHVVYVIAKLPWARGLDQCVRTAHMYVYAFTRVCACVCLCVLVCACVYACVCVISV